MPATTRLPYGSGEAKRRYVAPATRVGAREPKGDMSDVVDLLTEAFDEEPRRPSVSDLGAGIRATGYWSFAPNLEVVVAEAARPPADGHAVRAWRTRLDRRPIPLVLLIESDVRTLVVGPAGDPPPVVNLDVRLVSDELAAARELDPLDVRRRLPAAWERARGAGGLTGLRNVGLFSAHYLKARAPQLPGWDQLAEAGRAASRGKTLPARLDALGFEHEEEGRGDLCAACRWSPRRRRALVSARARS